MTRDEDIRLYAERPWNEVDKLKRRYWSEVELPADEALRIADDLRRSARSLRPEWPGAFERERDIETHARVAEALLQIAT